MIFARFLIFVIALIVPIFTYLAKTPPAQTSNTPTYYYTAETNPNLPLWQRYRPLIGDSILWFGSFWLLYRLTKRLEKGGILLSILLIILFLFLFYRYLTYAVEEEYHRHDKDDKSGFLYWVRG